jgi:hypothetical protein
MSSTYGNRLSELRKTLAACVRTLRNIKDELAQHPETEITFKSLQETITEIHQSYDACNAKRRRSEPNTRHSVTTSMTHRPEPHTSERMEDAQQGTSLLNGADLTHVHLPFPRERTRTTLSEPMLRLIEIRARSYVSLSFTLKTHHSCLTSLEEHISSGSLPENMPPFAKHLIQTHAEMADKVQCAKMLLLERQIFLRSKIMDVESKMTVIKNTLPTDVEELNCERESSMDHTAILKAFEAKHHRITEEFLYKQQKDKFTKAKTPKQQRRDKGKSPQATSRPSKSPKEKSTTKKLSSTGKGKGTETKVKISAPRKSVGRNGKN